MAATNRFRRGLLVLGVLVVICGAAISGWPAPLLLSQPIEASVGKGVIVPQGLSAARWALGHLPAGSVYVERRSHGRELLVGGAGYTLLGNGGNVPALLHTPELPSWQRETLTRRGVDYVVLDRRKVSSSNQAAYFFQRGADPSDGLGYYPPGVRAKSHPRNQLDLRQRRHRDHTSVVCANAHHPAEPSARRPSRSVSPAGRARRSSRSRDAAARSRCRGCGSLPTSRG